MPSFSTLPLLTWCSEPPHALPPVRPQLEDATPLVLPHRPAHRGSGEQLEPSARDEPGHAPSRLRQQLELEVAAVELAAVAAVELVSVAAVELWRRWQRWWRWRWRRQQRRSAAPTLHLRGGRALASTSGLEMMKMTTWRVLMLRMMAAISPTMESQRSIVAGRMLGWTSACAVCQRCSFRGAELPTHALHPTQIGPLDIMDAHIHVHAFHTSHSVVPCLVRGGLEV